MRSVLPEDIELTFEVLGVKRTAPGGVSLAIVRTKHDERLEDSGLLACSIGTEDGAVGGNLAPAEDSEAELGGNLGENGLLLMETDRVVRLEEDVSDAVLTRLGKLAADIPLSLTLEEEMGNASHDSSTIPIPTFITRINIILIRGPTHTFDTRISAQLARA